MNKSLLLLSVLLTGTILSEGASSLKIEEVDSILEQSPQYKSIPSKRTFQGDPARTAAGILPYAIDEKKEVLILLGIRDDDESLCNPGGGSKDGETLDQTASREAEEETNGYYAYHPHDLKSLPFIDLYDKRKEDESVFYRLYWKKVRLVDTHILMKALEEGGQAEGKEYTEFHWVSLRKILTALKNQENIELENGTNIPLYEPLFQALSTDSALAYLNEIAIKGDISRFNKSLQSYFNRLYLIDDKPIQEDPEDLPIEEYAEFKLHWHLPDHFAPVETYTERLPSGKTITGYKVPAVPFGKNAWGESHQTLTINGFEPKTIPLSVEKDRSDFAYAVAAHGAAMVELKHKYYQKSPLNVETTQGWNPSCDLTLSRIHLRLVLGEAFKTGQDFQDELPPQRTADIENLRSYLTIHSETENDQDGVTDEFKRQINFTNQDLEHLADLLAWEEEHKSYPILIHGANADLNNLWNSFTHMRELLSLTPLVGHKLMMRGTDIYFRNAGSLDELFTAYGANDTPARASALLCANVITTAGLSTTNSTSSSIEYFLNNHSVAPPDIEKKFDEATALAGIVGHYPFFRSPFLQYLAHNDSTFENSVIMGIAAPPSLIAAHAFASNESGTHLKEVNGVPVPILEIYKRIQGEYEAPKETLKSSEDGESDLISDDESDLSQEDEKEGAFPVEKRHLFPEARLSLHPRFVFDPNTRMKVINRFPLTEDEQKQFDQEMRQASIGTLAHWLSSHTKVMPGSFIEYPSLKTLYHTAYKGMTGKEAEESFAMAGFSHLLANDHFEGAKEFLKAYPDIDLDPWAIIFETLRTSQKPIEMLTLIYESFFAQKSEDFEKHRHSFFKAVRLFYNKFYNKTLVEGIEFLFTHFNIKEIPEEIVLAWLNTNISSFHDGRDAEPLLKYFPQYKLKILETICKGRFKDVIIDSLIQCGISFEQIIDGIFENNNKDIIEILKSILNKITYKQVKLDKAHEDQIYQFLLDQDATTVTALFRYCQNPFKLADEWVKLQRGKTVPESASRLIELGDHWGLWHVLGSGGKSTPFLEMALKAPLSKEAFDILKKNSIFLMQELTKLENNGRVIPRYLASLQSQPEQEFLSDAEETQWLKKALSDVETHYHAGQVPDLPTILSHPEIVRKKLDSVFMKFKPAIIVDILNYIYPNRQDFINAKIYGIYSIKLKHPLEDIFLYPSLANTNTWQAVYDYMGSEICDLIMAHKDFMFKNFLWPDTEGDRLFKEFPDLFIYSDENYDFFKIVIDNLYETNDFSKKVVLHHKSKVKEVDKKSGYPYLFFVYESLYDDEDTDAGVPLMSKLIKEDPTLLEVKSIDGISFEDFVCDIKGAKSAFQKMIKDLRPKKRKRDGSERTSSLPSKAAKSLTPA